MGREASHEKSIVFDLRKEGDRRAGREGERRGEERRGEERRGEERRGEERRGEERRGEERIGNWLLKEKERGKERGKETWKVDIQGGGGLPTFSKQTLGGALGLGGR